MKRLIIAEHDIGNRDVAFIDINGKFYEDATHALCIRKYLKDIKSDIGLESYQYRPNIQDFSELSKDGYIVLGHLVKKEDGVFIIYAIENERFMEFDDIPKQYIDEISNHYSLPCYDDKKHEKTEENNHYNYEENNEKFYKNVEKAISEDSFDYLLNNGFSYNEEENFFTNGYVNVKIKNDHISAYSIGDNNIEFFGINKIDTVNKLKPSDIYNKLCELGAEFIYKYFDKTIANFKNCDGNLDIEVVMTSSTKCYLNDMKGNKELINKIGDMGLYLTSDLDMDTIDRIYNLREEN